MRIISSPKKIQKICLHFKKRGKTIALVPTMGYLHQGHVTLLKKARRKGKIVVLSIFVNPTQFGPMEDYDKYPRDLKGDLKKAREAGVDFVFLPTKNLLYPENFETVVEVPRMAEGLCGAFRPHHFKGVATIVAKLFNLVLPDFAFFGLKDYQQFAVIKRMTADLNMPLKIMGVPTVREKDGLAMSSRNVYLNPGERKSALCLFEGLTDVKTAVKKGEKNVANLCSLLLSRIEKEKPAKIDYVSCVHADTLEPLETYQQKKTLFAAAVFIGKTRLIDNMVV